MPDGINELLGENEDQIVEGRGVSDDDHAKGATWSQLWLKVSRSCSKSSAVYFSMACSFRNPSSS
jgi:hypothetical protein